MNVESFRQRSAATRKGCVTAARKMDQPREAAAVEPS